MSKFYTLNANSDVVTADDVVPSGPGTEVIATIGGKQIKAPAGGGGGTVVKVAGVGPDDNGNVPLQASHVGALPITGGTLVADGGFVALNVGKHEKCSGIIRALGNGVIPGKIEAVGDGASIKKDGAEVATEEQVADAQRELNARIDLVEMTSHPNMDIVGAPTFSQGTVSGFSANDYLVFPTQVDVGANEVDFYLAFTTGANVTAQQNILDSWCGLAFAIQNGGTVTAASYTGTEFITSAEAGVVAPNSAYRAKFSFRASGESYTVATYLADGAGEYRQIGNPIVMPGPLHPTATYWGGANPQSGVPHVYGGSINLAECRMDWNGRTVWRGYDELPTVKFDPTAEEPLDTAEKIAALSAYPMAAVVGGALKDRTINHATDGGTFTFPARTATNARDFVLVVDALATAPSVTFPAGVTYVSDQAASDVWTAEANKVNAWYFSEVKDGVFMVSHKAMDAVAQ